MNEELLKDVIEMRGVGNLFHWSYFRGPGDTHWSSDGACLAYVVNGMSVAQNRAYTELWVRDFTARKTRQLTFGLSDDGAPRWSPDGSSLAFVSSRRPPGGATAVTRDDLWLLPMAGGEPQPLTAGASEIACVLRDGCYFNLAWAPDGKSLYFTAPEAVPQPSEAPVCETIRFGRGEGYGRFQHERICIWNFDLNSRRLEKTVSNNFDVGDFTVSPDGRSIVYIAGKDHEPPWFSTSKKFDLFHLDLRSGKTVQLTSNPGTNLNPRYSPEGKWIAYKSTQRCGSHNDVAQLMVYSTETSKVRCLTPDFRYSPDALSRQCWSSDSMGIYFSAAVGCDNKLWRADLDGRMAPMEQLRPFSVFLGAAPSGERVAMQAGSPMQAPNLYAGPANKAEPVTEFNPELHTRAPYQYRLAAWSHPDGTALEGVFFLPQGSHKPCPCIVIPHGGPHVRSPAVLTPDALVFLDAGIAIFLPNYRGSSGYGQAFIDADRADWGGKDFEDIMCGVDHLIQEGHIDGEKLGIWGPSYGGFMTAWAIGHTNRFKAAVVFNGIANLFSKYGQTDYKEATEWEFYGFPWDNLALIMEHSPITHIGKARTPTLLAYGDGDHRVPIAQGYELFTALSRLGVETEFIKYAGATHALGQPRHRLDYFRRVLSWFQNHGLRSMP